MDLSSIAFFLRWGTIFWVQFGPEAGEAGLEVLKVRISPEQFADAHGPDWAWYSTALRSLDEVWRKRMVGNTAFGVFGERPSWEDTISRAQALFDVDSWADLGEDQVSLIAPAHSFAGGDALLGSVGRRSTAVRDFLLSHESAVDRDYVLMLLKQAQRLKLSTVPILGGELLTELKSVRGMGRSFATRLLTLARPDGFVVVNNKSRDWLKAASGLSLGSSRNTYSDLLRWVSRQNWHSCQEPNGVLERRLWKIRSALLDAFAYRPWS